MKFRTRYDRAASNVARKNTAIDTGPDGPVQKQFKKDSDINELVRRFGLTGRMPAPVVDPAYYGDVDDVYDLRTALDRVRDAKERFAALPARVRSRFHNSPAELFDFLDDDSNRPEAEKLGLLKEKEAAPVVTPPVGGGEPTS